MEANAQHSQELRTCALHQEEVTEAEKSVKAYETRLDTCWWIPRDCLPFVLSNAQFTTVHTQIIQVKGLSQSGNEEKTREMLNQLNLILPWSNRSLNTLIVEYTPWILGREAWIVLRIEIEKSWPRIMRHEFKGLFVDKSMADDAFKLENERMLDCKQCLGGKLSEILGAKFTIVQLPVFVPDLPHL